MVSTSIKYYSFFTIHYSLKNMKILVLNCGSSSIKYQLFEMETKTVLAKGGIEKIGLPGAFIKFNAKALPLQLSRSS